MSNDSGSTAYFKLNNLSTTLKKGLLDCGIDELDFRFLKDIISLKVSMFEYENLPNTINPDSFVEENLMFSNNLCFFNIPALGGVCLCRWSARGLNFNDRPKFVNLKSLKGDLLLENIPFNELVLLKDNALDIPPIISILEYLTKIKEVESVIERNLTLLNLPILFTGDKKLIASVQQIFKKSFGLKKDENVFAFADQTVRNSFQPFNISLPVSPDVLYNLKDKYKNECLNSIGIFNTGSIKSERVQTFEVESSNDYVNFIYQSMVELRKNAIKKCNAKFGTNIKLIEVYKKIEQEDENKEKGEGINEQQVMD